jgi:monofunctional biosynthetic peptidoglycan transglycosylase
LRVIVVLVAVLLLLSIVVTAGLRWFNPPTSAFMLAARATALLNGDRDFVVDYRWRPLHAQSRWAALAVIASEDQKFKRHGGFDFEAMQSAINAHQRGASLRGASTLTQQLAKNLYLWSGRSWLRKVLEAWLTVLLESTLSKPRILELYLNVVQFGPGVYGVEAASQQLLRSRRRHALSDGRSGGAGRRVAGAERLQRHRRRAAYVQAHDSAG